MNKRQLLPLVLAFLSLSLSAREFQSDIKMKIFVRGTSEIPDQVIGFTPVRPRHRILIPVDQLWYVRPSGNFEGARLEALVAILLREKVPGLDLSDHWELTDKTIQSLRPLKGLKMLDLSRTRITDAGLSVLRSFPHLAVLSLPATISDRSVVNLLALGDLRELNLDQTRISSKGLTKLTRLSRLEFLDLSSTRIDNAGIAPLARLPKLKRLVLGPLVSDAASSSLKALRALQEIDISQTQIRLAGYSALATLPKLKTLYVNQLISDAGLKRLEESHSLRAIDLSRSQVTDKGILHLAKIHTLEEVALGQTAVTNACLTALARMPELRMLDLSDTRITSAGLAPLRRARKLEVLSLSWQKLSRQDLQGMAKLKQLKSIILNGNPLPEATMAQLRRLGSPSPWEPVDGLERARQVQVAIRDHRALAAPVAIRHNRSAGKEIPEAPPYPQTARLHADSLPKQVDDMAEIPTTDQRTIVKDHPKERSGTIPASKIRRSGSEEALHPAPSSAPVDRASRSAHEDNVLRIARLTPAEPKTPSLGGFEAAPKPAEETRAIDRAADQPVSIDAGDHLLEVITLQSSPGKAGIFSGLAGMRQFRHAQTVASLNTLSTATEKVAMEPDESKPENFLGEISVGASSSVRQRKP